ncbi:MAG: 50S ribosomal protein L18 [Dehalococcoidia bacterium]|jgi:large subunit ribosomal protein L18|nr:50S ribosomal protein L18 [Dehalococcoidia bacterium]
MTIKSRKQLRNTRKMRVRKKVNGTSIMPRLSIFRSNKYIYAQLIDDSSGNTLTAADDKNIKDGNNMSKAQIVGSSIAKNAKKIGIEKIVFDTSGYRYTGRIQALADAAREEGLIF